MPPKKINVLVVDDNATVLQYLAAALAASGFDSIQAKDGVEALRVIDSTDETIDILLLDVVMPRLNGKELARVILSAHPDMKIILMSGYPEETIADKGLPLENTRFLQKPFSTTQLVTLIHTVLNKDAANNPSD
jgi:two-component system cell cycle sensor histidine kinase/response regulator CckA